MISLVGGGPKNNWLWLLLPLSLFGCKAPPQTDVSADAARLTGVSGAIVFHDTLAPGPATAPSIATLSQEQSIRLALENDPRIQSALGRVRGAEADAKQARHLANPVISVDVRAPQNGPPTAIETALSEDLISLLSKPAQISAADDRLRAAAADALTTVLDVIAEVQNAYTSIQSIDAEVAYIQEQEAIISRMRDLAQQRLTAGEATRLDVLTLAAQRAQLVVAMSDLRLQRVEQRLILARLIGQPRGAADWQLDPWREPLALQSEESAWIDAALINRPEIQSRSWELAALGSDRDVADFAPLNGATIGAHAEHDPVWRVGPTLSTPVPIFDFGQDTRGKARALVFAARQDLAQQKLMVIEEVRRAYATYKATLEELTTARNDLIPLQEQQHQQAELAYQSGDTDLATLLLAENELRSTRATMVGLQQKVAGALVRLQRAAGGSAVAARVPTTLPAAATEPAATRPDSGLLQ
ncbi:MAG: TolC family protein [Planctomycetota bacterium]|nr:TolC family protein [Planctomycetota bacterium]